MKRGHSGRSGVSLTTGTTSQLHFIITVLSTAKDWRTRTNEMSRAYLFLRVQRQRGVGKQNTNIAAQS